MTARNTPVVFIHGLWIDPSVRSNYICLTRLDKQGL